jgi:hypothetical protein
MIRMLIVGYCFGIRSERRLCEEVHLNLAYRWFCRLGLDGEASRRAVKEYMAALDDEAFGAATDVVPQFISPADPAARWTGAHGGQAFFG